MEMALTEYYNLLGLKGLVKEIHCCPSSTSPDTSKTSSVQEPAVESSVSGHAPSPPRHCMIMKSSRLGKLTGITTRNVNYLPVYTDSGSSLVHDPVHWSPPRLW